MAGAAHDLSEKAGMKEGGPVVVLPVAYEQSAPQAASPQGSVMQPPHVFVPVLGTPEFKEPKPNNELKPNSLLAYLGAMHSVQFDKVRKNTPVRYFWLGAAILTIVAWIHRFYTIIYSNLRVDLSEETEALSRAQAGYCYFLIPVLHLVLFLYPSRITPSDTTRRSFKIAYIVNVSICMFVFVWSYFALGLPLSLYEPCVVVLLVLLAWPLYVFHSRDEKLYRKWLGMYEEQ